MRVQEVREKWLARREALGKLAESAMVPMSAVIDELLTDLDNIVTADDDTPLSLREASQVSGYSVDHLQRLVASGRVKNVGRKHKPRIRRCDLPVKPQLRIAVEEGEVVDRRRIVASVVNGEPL